MRAFVGELKKGDAIRLNDGRPATVRKLKADGGHFRLTVAIAGVETTALVTACTQYDLALPTTGEAR